MKAGKVWLVLRTLYKLSTGGSTMLLERSHWLNLKMYWPKRPPKQRAADQELVRNI